MMPGAMYVYVYVCMYTYLSYVLHDLIKNGGTTAKLFVLAKVQIATVSATQLENVAVLAGNVKKSADAIHFAKLNKK